MRLLVMASLLGATALPALAQEVNLYSHRQPELLKPLERSELLESLLRA